MAESSLAGKVALITGSGREDGIGAGIAHALSRLGASVIINYVSESSAPRALEVESKIKAAGGKVAVVQGSITTREGARGIVRGALEGLGVEKIDILGTCFLLSFMMKITDENKVNNAGGPTNLKHTGKSSPLIPSTSHEYPTSFHRTQSELNPPLPISLHHPH
jgi:NAD(P)-dependent dehydrogenase (short-subunit alcohol dehydrogenase family)